MTSKSPEVRAREVQHMFNRIAPRYDLMNRLMTFGMDVRLRKIVVMKTALPLNGSLLDLAAGTGDLAKEAHHQFPGRKIIAADFSINMMQAGQKRPGKRLDFTAADALNIPFNDETFDAVISGFLLRNVVDLNIALKEQWRVLKQGGIFVSLDTTQPPSNILSPFIHFYTHQVIPFLGQILSGDREAYVYLPTSTDHFLSAEELKNQLQENGFKDINFNRHMFGTVAIHWARKN
ncbi:MAG: ubiquinone/menaquinone biosynthesis methyltransferase [Anaerolineaceae bacterium]|nr:ubiquinone/menaquinone biosynthesis methyltransferase [Anaerolineaceae bacterium]